MVLLVCAVLGVALFLIMLSYVPWAQSNLRWISTFRFFILVGAIVGSGIVYMLYRLGLEIWGAY